MPEDQKLEAEVNTEEQTQDPHPGLSHLNEDDRQLVLSLRKEASDKRVKNKELAKELEAVRTQIQENKEQKMREDGKLQELLTEKEKELEDLLKVKEENETLKQHFEKQLEAATQKLSKEQQELINESGWDIAKKLEWALRFTEKGQSQTESPDAKRPGGEQPDKNIDLNEYQGPQGRKKLVMLKRTNPKRYDLIMSLKQ